MEKQSRRKSKHAAPFLGDPQFPPADAKRRLFESAAEIFGWREFPGMAADNCGHHAHHIMWMVATSIPHL